MNKKLFISALIFAASLGNTGASGIAEFYTRDEFRHLLERHAGNAQLRLHNGQVIVLRNEEALQFVDAYMPRISKNRVPVFKAAQNTGGPLLLQVQRLLHGLASSGTPDKTTVKISPSEWLIVSGRDCPSISYHARLPAGWVMGSFSLPIKNEDPVMNFTLDYIKSAKNKQEFMLFKENALSGAANLSLVSKKGNILRMVLRKPFDFFQPARIAGRILR